MKETAKLNLKYKPFSYYQQKYYHKLKQPNSIIEPLNLLCGGWSLQTFNQVINKLSANKSSPLPLYFASPESMEMVGKNKTLIKQIFKFFDSRELGRIDACELYCALMIIAKGAYETFLRCIVEIFGFEYHGRIQKQEFFFFLDSLFRALPKMVIIKGFEKPVDPNIRLQYSEINSIINVIFGEKNEIERNQIYESMLKHKQLNEFIKYIQKRCTASAENCRNQTIERVSIQAEVRGCLIAIIDKIQHLLRSEQFQKILL